MKRLAVIVPALVLTLFFTAFFYLSPPTVIEIINSYLPDLNLRYNEGSGNILTGFRFRKISVVKDSSELLEVNNLKVSFSYLPLIIGKTGVEIKSDEVKGKVDFSIFGNLQGFITINGLYFDTASFNFKEDIQFSAKLNGRLNIMNSNVVLEIKTEDLNWRKLSISGIDLPFTLFSEAKGGILFSKGKVVVKSINFEGPKGNARISGEVVGGAPKLELEIIPKDWTEPYLIPLEQYKTSPGYYKISFSM
ncbi:MAG: hypothetical protein OHK0040_04180 [bacterium]